MPKIIRIEKCGDCPLYEYVYVPLCRSTQRIIGEDISIDSIPDWCPLEDEKNGSATV